MPAAQPRELAPRKSRSQILDILRFVAVMMVLGRHIRLWPSGAFGTGFTFFWSNHWIYGGWTGVDLFFVLSGFLISGLLFEEAKRSNAIDLRSFWIRRGLKIYPAFYVLVAWTVISALLFGSGFNLPLAAPLNIRSLLAEIFFVQNYHLGIWLHTWSLAVEEHFYFLLPLLLAFLLRRRGDATEAFRILPALTIAVAVVCLGLRILAVPSSASAGLFETHLRLDSLFFGVGLGYLYHFRPEVLDRIRRQTGSLLLALFGVALFVPAFFLDPETNPWMRSIGLTLFAVGGVAILIALVDVRPSAHPFARIAAFLGSRSYSVYLWHGVAAALAIHLWEVHGVSGGPLWWDLYLVVYFALAFALGLTVAALVEMPIVRLRDAIVPRRANAMERLPATVGLAGQVSGQSSP